MNNKKYQGALELKWINKDKSLLFEIDEDKGQGIKPTWVDRVDIRVSEPRILRLKNEIGDPDNNNILIKGDNLLTLRTLVEIFKNKNEKDKVKCIYLDPPFNTGSAFEYYDDNLEHSQWLTMMKDRIVLLKKLLREDGVIFIHIDYREFAYLKMLMDEIFGRKNILSFITLKVKDPAGVGQQSPIFDICEYLLCYAKDFQVAKNNIAKKAYEYVEVEKPVKGYYKALTNPGIPKLIEVIERQNVGKIRIFSCKNYHIENLSGKSFKEYIKYYSSIFVDYNPSGGMILAIKNNIPRKGLSYIEYVPTKGKSAGKLTKVYFHNRRILAWLKDISKKNKNQIIRKKKMSNLWFTNTAGLPKEGDVYFPQSKKPESLIARIIELSTEKGDLVLDSFLGSGTTAAVAHKLRRRWIGIEIGDHAETLCVPRLTRVTLGKDQTGISKQINWKGGGGFRYYLIGDSVLFDDDMNWKLTFKEIAEAVFINFGFKMHHCSSGIGLTKKVFIGKSRRKGRYALCSITKDIEIIGFDELMGWMKVLKKHFSEWREVEIYTNKGVGIRGDKLPEGIIIKKIPEALLTKYNL